LSSRVISFEQKYQAKLEAYASVYRIDDLNDANDRSTLDIMLKTEIMIDDLQEQLQLLMADSAVENAGNIKKLADLLRDATGTITTLQKTLAIDRKTRKTDEAGSVADYIRSLKKMAVDFLDQRFTKMYCPNCKVMVGRYMAVHDHTAFNIQFQCSQCGKAVRARRDDRDVLFDVRDADWRKAYRSEIVKPKKTKTPVDDLSVVMAGNEIMIDSSDLPAYDNIDFQPRVDVEVQLENDVEIGDVTTE